MEGRIFVHDDIYVAPSPIHGYGVFTDSSIEKHTVVEECHLLTIPSYLGENSTFMVDYKFGYPGNGISEEYVLPLGYGCIYNHSINNNTAWCKHPEKKLFIFYTIRDVEKGEELCTNYGGHDYWKWKDSLKSNQTVSVI